VEVASAHNGAMVLSLQMNGEKCQEWQSTGSGSQPAVAVNRRWQSTGGGNQPVAGSDSGDRVTIGNTAMHCSEQ